MSVRSWIDHLSNIHPHPSLCKRRFPDTVDVAAAVAATGEAQGSGQGAKGARPVAKKLKTNGEAAAGEKKQDDELEEGAKGKSKADKKGGSCNA